MVGTALKWLLIGYGADGYNPQYDIYNFIGDNLYPNVLPQNVGYPAVVYTIDKTNPDKVKEIRALDNRVSVDIEVVDKSYAVVNQISTLIINQLHRYNNIYNSNDSDGIGYGTTEGSNKFGRFAPASTGDTQYVGGLQIKYLAFNNSIDSYDDKLNIYRNSLSFDMMYVDDLTIWGADVMLKFTDLNLMATSVGATDDPLYTQPLAINQGVNYLFTPSVLVSDNTNIESTTLNGIYENFNDPSGTSNTNRPILKLSANTPPKFNGNNYIEFFNSKYLLSSKATDRLDRKYKELTFFSVINMPNSYSASKTASILFKRTSTTASTGSVFLNTKVIGDPSTTGLVQFNAGGMALEDDGAGGETHRGFNFFGGIVSWPMFGLLTDLSFEDPLYFAVNFKRKEGDNTRLQGEYELITSSDFTIYGDTDSFESWEDESNTTFKEYFFNFESLHTDIGSYDTKGAGTLNMNDEYNLYNFVMWPDFITMGSNKYNEIKRSIIQSHNMYKRITN
tara:strand:+ start:6306 stop:7823 length:1518 start_codon:yes stop_codon:yes gene_type:complete